MNISALTQLLNANSSDLSSRQQADMDRVYIKLKQIAKSQRFKIKNNGIDTTELVNEAWLASKGKNKTFNDRNHFFAYCSIAMRHILIQQARKNRLLTFIDNENLQQHVVYKQSDYLLELERQLQKLKVFSPRLEQIFTYKYYGDMDFDAIAELLDISERTVFRDWKKARAMLSIALSK
jgi:RNA polymerase sigma factor (TIGR02999 family)